MKVSKLSCCLCRVIAGTFLWISIFDCYLKNVRVVGAPENFHGSRPEHENAMFLYYIYVLVNTRTDVWHFLEHAVQPNFGLILMKFHRIVGTLAE